MPASSPVNAIERAQLSALLACARPEGRRAFLEEAELFNAEGLSFLLEEAHNLAGSDPGQARQLAGLCASFAAEAGVPQLIPKADYLQAQTYAANGELEAALEAINAAHDGYIALEKQLPALRTNVGRMTVLTQLGRHQEVLALGNETLTLLGPFRADPATGEQAELVSALVHQNRGICFRRMGRYQDALQAYTAAEPYYENAEMRVRLGELRNNQGVLLLHLGRVSDALVAFESAAAMAAKMERPLLEVEALINCGEAHLLLGNYRQSLEALGAASRLVEGSGAEASELLVRLHRADVYQALNLFPEALADYQEAAAGYGRANVPHYRARALWGMGAALNGQAEFEEAEEALAEAAVLFRETEHVPMLATVYLEQAALQAARGESSLALSSAEEALSLVTEQEWPVQQVYAHMRLADLLLPDTEAAEAHLLAARTLSEPLVFPQLRYRLVERLGALRRRQGQMVEARAMLEEAVADIERMRGTVAQEAMRVSFLHDKIVAYEELLLLYLEEEAPRATFAVAEQAKSRALVDLLLGVVPSPATSSDPADPELAEQLARLETELNAIYNEFLSGGTEREPAAARPELQQRAQALEQKIRRLRLQTPAVREEGDPFAMLPLAEIEAQLPSDLVLLAYHIVGEEVLAFVNRNGEWHLRRHLTTVPEVQTLLQRLSIQWDRFRAGQSFARRHMSLLVRSTQRVLHALYQQLVAPLADFLQEGTAASPVKVVVIPHGLLHQVPFHALFDGKDYLLERAIVSYAPSATVFAICATRDSSTPQRALVAGVSDPLIPAVRQEVEAVAEQLPDARVYLDEETVSTQVLADAPVADVIHLACHGLFRADNPMFSALKLYNKWLTAADIMQLELNQSLVTLSACESGVSQVVVGDEVIGLARAFLGAGASTLLVSLWLVQDDTTAELMGNWYGQLRLGAGRAAALRTAQLRLKEEYAHPYYWAPFILVGQP